MTQPDKSYSRCDRFVLFLAWLAVALDFWQLWRMRPKPEDLAWLKQATETEGRRLAEAVRAGKITRADVERMLKETGDGEPAFALKFLNEWGITK